MADSGRISGDCRHRAGYGEPCEECRRLDDASGLLTKEELIVYDDLLRTASSYRDYVTLDIIDRLTAKVRAGESLADAAKNGVGRLDVDYEDPITQRCAQQLRTALAAYRSVK